MKGLWFAAAVLGTLTVASRASSDTPPVQEVQYRTKINDTLSGLAQRYLLHPSDYRIVQEINHIAIPEHLPPNVLLRVPVSLLRYDPAQARIVSFRGDVRIDTEGKSARAGMVLDEGTRLETGASAFLTIRVADGSIISMPSQSVMRLARMRRVRLTGDLDQEFAVDHGHVETSVKPQGDSQYRFRTPIAVSAVRGTMFRVAYGDGPSLTEVLGGTVAVGQPGAVNPVSVPKGIGAAVSQDGAVATETLLPAPQLASPAAIQAKTTVHFAFTPLPGAVSYHVQLAQDAAFEKIFAEARSTTPEANFEAVPNGDFFLRATAISKTKFEGLPAIYPFSRQLTLITGSAKAVTQENYLFSWKRQGPPGVHYRFQLYVVPNTEPIVDMPALKTDRAMVYHLPGGDYRWRVGAIPNKPESGVPETWSEPMTFHVEGPGW